jgi:hypothetical protein
MNGQATMWRVVVNRDGKTETRFYNSLNKALAIAKGINEDYRKPVAFVATPIAGAAPGAEPWLAE